MTVGRAKGIYWDSNMVVPLNKMIYDTETRIVKKGNGNDFLEDLPIYLDLNNVEDIATFYNEVFPQIGEETSGFLLTNDINGFTIYSNPEGTSIITKDELLATLEFYANNVHEHLSIDIHGLGTASLHSVGLRYNEIPVLSSNGKLDKSIIPPNISLNDNDSDIISYLMLSRLYKNNPMKIDMPKGIVDEFNDLSGIDVYNSGEYRHENGAIFKNGYNYYLTSIAYEDIDGNNPIYVFVRGKLNSGILNKDIVFEISNDNTNWSQVVLKQVPMITSNINCYSGIVELGEIRRQESLEFKDMTIEDVKGGITSFTVDIINNAGHFNAPINDRIKVGQTLYTENQGRVVITTIMEDGTLPNSVQFRGILPVDTYTNIRISPVMINKENGGLTLSGIKDMSTGIYTLVNEYATAILDMTSYVWKYFFDKSITGELNGIHYNLIFGYSDDTYAYYNQEIQEYIEIVKKQENQWHYYDTTNNMWVAHNDILPNVISKAFAVNQLDNNDILDIRLIPMIRSDKQLTKLAIVMKNPTDNNPTATNGITKFDIDGISKTGTVIDNTNMVWRNRQLNESSFDLHGIRIRY
jgi:hypothetical protein